MFRKSVLQSSWSGWHYGRSSGGKNEKQCELIFIRLFYQDNCLLIKNLMIKTKGCRLGRVNLKKIPAMSSGLIVVIEMTIFYYTTWVFALIPEEHEGLQYSDFYKKRPTKNMKTEMDKPRAKIFLGQNFKSFSMTFS